MEVERKLDKFTPDEFKRNAHHWLILHGRYVCVARKPKCPECIIRDLCEYRHKTPGDPRRIAAVATLMFNPSRDEARRFLIDAWKKSRDGAPLSDLERVAAGAGRAASGIPRDARAAGEVRRPRLRSPSPATSIRSCTCRCTSRSPSSSRSTSRRAFAPSSSASATRAATSTPRCTRCWNAWAR